MEIVYDIELANGDVLKECYFIEYQRKIKNRYGSTMIILPESLRCFIDGKEILNKDFNGATVLKVYDKTSGIDMTDLIFGKVQNVSESLGYSVPFPIARDKVILD